MVTFQNRMYILMILLSFHAPWLSQGSVLFVAKFCCEVIYPDYIAVCPVMYLAHAEMATTWWTSHTCQMSYMATYSLLIALDVGVMSAVKRSMSPTASRSSSGGFSGSCWRD